MKKTQNIFGILCLIIAIFSSCSKNITDSEDVKEVVNNDYLKKATVFSATLEQSTATKTILQNDGKIYWSPEDSINVFGKNQYKFTSTLKEEAPNTEFITEDNFEEADGQSFVAVYPYSKSNSYDGEAVTLSVPSSQIASLATFDKNAFVMLAKSDAHTLSFRNLCGGIKVSITADGINRIVFKGNNGEALAGKVKVIFDESGYPVVSEIIEKESSVELIAPKDSTFSVGEWYYLSCLPTDLSQGYTVEFYKEYSDLVIEASLVSDSPVVVKRSVWGRIKDADEDSHYTATPNDNTILYTTSDGSRISFSTYFYVLEHYKDAESGYNVIVLTEKTNYLPHNIFKNSEVTSVILPSNIKYIGKDAFSGCSSLASIHLPSSVTTIEEYAFMNCSSLASIHLPSGVTSIGKNAFWHCSSLASIDIPSSVTIIGEYAFRDCSSLASIHLPSGITTIEDGSFSGCSSLTSIAIPSGVTSIGKYAFRDCSSLASIDVPSGITTIEDGSFSGCSSLTSIAIPSGVTTIGESAFLNCSSLASIDIPSVNSIAGDAFSGCENIVELSCGQYVVSDDRNIKTLFPSSYDKIMKIHLYDDVTSIGNSAFEGCSSMTSIEIPSAVTRIGGSAFKNCSSLTSVDIPSSVEYIAYYNKKISQGRVYYYESTVFSGCISLETVSCGQYVVSKTSFRALFPSSYDKIRHIHLYEDVTSIGECVFMDCSSLTSIEIPVGVTTIGSFAFDDCSSLASIDVPSGITTIADSSFSGCSSLTSIEIPSAVTGIGGFAFYRCSSLTSIEIPSSVTRIGGSAFKNCSSLASIDVPSGITSIEDDSFSGCSSLTSIEIPSAVTKIGSNAFEGCNSLTSIEIPSSVTKIGNYAFSSCIRLKSVIVNPSTPPSGGIKMFYNNAHLRLIYVPRASLSSYQDAQFWNDYESSIRPM